jgi:hypothetical protein
MGAPDAYAIAQVSASMQSDDAPPPKPNKPISMPAALQAGDAGRGTVCKCICDL